MSQFIKLPNDYDRRAFPYMKPSPLWAIVGHQYSFWRYTIFRLWDINWQWRNRSTFNWSLCPRPHAVLSAKSATLLGLKSASGTNFWRPTLPGCYISSHRPLGPTQCYARRQ